MKRRICPVCVDDAPIVGGIIANHARSGTHKVDGFPRCPAIGYPIASDDSINRAFAHAFIIAADAALRLHLCRKVGLSYAWPRPIRWCP